MQKTHCWPEGHWNWPVRVSHKHGVRCGEMIWIGGQVDMSPDAAVLNQGDLVVQTMLKTVFEEGCKHQGSDLLILDVAFDKLIVGLILKVLNIFKVSRIGQRIKNINPVIRAPI